MKIGAVLEGGAMRGMYTAGVLDVLMENDIFVDGAIGVSAGATFGCNYKSKQIGRTIRYNLKYRHDPRYASIRSLLKTGELFGEQFCYHDIPERLDPFDADTFQSTPMEFYVVCTDVETGKPVYHKCTRGDGEDTQWIRASASMPVVSKVVNVGGYGLLDGGISDSIPLKKIQELGYEKNIVVLTQPDGYRKQPNKLIPLMKFSLKNNPEIIKDLAKRHEMYNNELDYVEKCQQEGNTFVLRPSKNLNIKRTEKDLNKLKSLYELGKSDALNKLAEIKEFIGSNEYRVE